ncbi:NTP transferase domain-containing protein [Arcticibacter tournemirensis]|nr:NTP transferase domain-containing protein [Arcticibacter tournemirensis]
MNIREAKLKGLILSGGRSTRMGRDKGSISYHGKSQREYLRELLVPFCQEVFISCNKEQIHDLDGFAVIEDSVEGQGPMIGILSAFQQDPGVAWLTVACDLPFLTQKTVDHLVTHRNASKLATAFHNPETGFPEPLITIWEPEARQSLLDFREAGYLCPRKVLINSDIELLEAVDKEELRNVNHAHEYETVIKKLEERAIFNKAF